MWIFEKSYNRSQTILALLLCTLKGYWIDKYNDGKDLVLPEKKPAATITKK